MAAHDFDYEIDPRVPLSAGKMVEERRTPIYEDRDPVGYAAAKQLREQKAFVADMTRLEEPEDLKGASLPSDAAERKSAPMAEGLLWYFPNALAEIARVSKKGNDQHNPGQPMHHARGKSNDHADCIIRHLVDAGKLDNDGQRHSAKIAWRALALLQEELERDLGLPLPRNAKAA